MTVTLPRSATPGCLVVFSLPFLAVGLYVVYACCAGGLLHPVSLNTLLFGAVFVLAGGVILVAGVRGLRTRSRRGVNRGASPDNPWLQRPDWARGHADANPGDGPAEYWTSAVLLNAIVWPVAVIIHGQPGAPLWAKVMMVALLAGGAVLMVFAVRRTMQVLRFGRTSLRLETVPIPLGRELRGTVEVRLPCPLPHGVRLTLTCVNRVVCGSGKNVSTSENVRWRGERQVSASEIALGPRGTAVIPVRFDVPSDMPPTDHSDPSSAVLWQLRAQADVAGVDLDEMYEVPVFRTADSTATEGEGARRQASGLGGAVAPPRQRSVEVHPAAAGETEYVFGAARNVGAAVGTTVVLLVVAAVEVAAVHFTAPVGLCVVFGVLVALFGWGALGAWFSASFVLVDTNGVTVRSTMLGVSRRRTWTRTAIRDVVCSIGMHTGRAARGTVYYDVVLEDAASSRAVIGRALRDHEEAEWIAQQIRLQLGLSPAAAGAAAAGDR